MTSRICEVLSRVDGAIGVEGEGGGGEGSRLLHLDPLG